MTQLIRSLIFLSASLSCLVQGDGYPLGSFPGAVLKQKSTEPEKSHMLVLGALEKVDRELRPENYKILLATKSSYTYYLPEARQTSEVFEYYFNQLGTIGNLEFDCIGRACGSSSYWANKIFNSAVLYGPEQFQNYAVFQTSVGGLSTLAREPLEKYMSTSIIILWMKKPTKSRVEKNLFQ